MGRREEDHTRGRDDHTQTRVPLQGHGRKESGGVVLGALKPSSWFEPYSVSAELTQAPCATHQAPA